VLQVIDAITRHLELGSFLAWPEEQRTSWLLAELAGRRPLFPPGIELSPDEAEVVNTFRCVRDFWIVR
jgi:phosphoenolpyruvate carboxylase